MKKNSAQFDTEGFLKTLTGRPGVYRMLGAEGVVLYVGKARNLKKRVTSYFRASKDSKTQAMVAQILSIEVTVTSIEWICVTSACVLESLEARK